jgi:hypothetical protein
MARRFTDEMTAGLQCLVYRLDYRQAPTREAVPVTHYDGGHMATCRGQCAETYSGHPGGPYRDEELLPLGERIAWADLD